MGNPLFLLSGTRLVGRGPWSSILGTLRLKRHAINFVLRPILPPASLPLSFLFNMSDSPPPYVPGKSPSTRFLNWTMPVGVPIEQLRPDPTYVQLILGAVYDIRICQEIFDGWATQLRTKKFEERERVLRHHLTLLREDVGYCSWRKGLKYGQDTTTFLHSCATAVKSGLGPRRAILRPVFMRASSPITRSASSNRARLFCAMCASFGTMSLRNRSTDSTLSDSFPARISASRLDDLRDRRAQYKRDIPDACPKRRMLLSKAWTQRAMT
ncbi:hypothetical protein EDB83DRAFT_2671419 [Lactarius deliciosus]|nr:hypothetical protein EDB83DRAFT_2671419 [Lactarius deliciosus]